MMREGKCTQCQQTKKLNVFKKLCDICLTQSIHVPQNRVPFKRKRYESAISAKSALSTQTQFTEIDDDDLECDGPSSDIDNDISREDTNPKTIEFDLHSVGSLSSQRYVNPIQKAGQTVPRWCASRNGPFSMSNTIQSIGSQNRQFAQAQTNRRLNPRIRKNFSESDRGDFCQPRYFNRRYSADDENVIEERLQNDSIVVVNEQLGNQSKIYLARPVKAAESDSNIHRINVNSEKLYESINDDDSGYMQHQFGRRPSRQNAQQDRLRAVNTDEELEKPNFCDKCLQSPTRFKWVLVISIVIAWAPVAVLSVLLLSSVHEGPPTSDPSSPDIGARQQRVIEEIINREVGKNIQGILASNSAPLRLKGVDLKPWNVPDYERRIHTHYRFKWSVPPHFVQNPISLMPDQVHVRVNMTGYYVVFCRIYYIGNHTTKQPFTVQHSLYKVNSSPNDDQLDSVTQHCMFMNDSKIEHTSTLQTLVYLEAGSKIYIRVRSTEFIDRRNNYSKHMMGIFLLPRVN